MAMLVLGRVGGFLFGGLKTKIPHGVLPLRRFYHTLKVGMQLGRL